MRSSLPGRFTVFRPVAPKAGHHTPDLGAESIGNDVWSPTSLALSAVGPVVLYHEAHSGKPEETATARTKRFLGPSTGAPNVTDQASFIEEAPKPLFLDLFEDRTTARKDRSTESVSLKPRHSVHTAAEARVPVANPAMREALDLMGQQMNDAEAYRESQRTVVPGPRRAPSTRCLQASSPRCCLPAP